MDTTTTTTTTMKINYGEKINGTYPETEKFLKRWICIEWNFYLSERGLLVRICSGPDWTGEIKDFAILRCIDEYEDVSDYAIIEVKSIRSIKIDTKMEKYFNEAEPKERERLLTWFEGGPTTEYLELYYLNRKMSLVKM